MRKVILYKELIKTKQNVEYIDRNYHPPFHNSV